jgi:hypothetical protein
VEYEKVSSAGFKPNNPKKTVLDAYRYGFMKEFR